MTSVPKTPVPKTPPDTSPSLRIDGCTVCTRMLAPTPNARREPGLPLLFLHGLGCSGDAWKPVLDTLSQTGCAQAVAAPDLPGYGHSECSQGALGMEALGDWTADFLDSLNLARVHVSGHSMGCQVALALARRHPERVASLLLVGPTTGRRLVPLWRYALGLAMDGFAEPPRYNLTLARMYAQMGAVRYFATVHRMMQDDPFAHASQVAAPTLIVRGVHDFVVPTRAARALAAALPHGRYLEVPRAAHALQFEEPDGFLDLAEPFWQASALPAR